MMDGWLVTLATAAAAFVGGLAAGAVLFGTLWWNVKLLVSGGSPMKAIAFQFVRLAFAGLILYAAVRFGALSLLAAALGLIVARFAAIRIAGEAPENGGNGGNGGDGGSIAP